MTKTKVSGYDRDRKWMTMTRTKVEARGQIDTMRGGTVSLTIPRLKNKEEGLVSPH